MAASGGGLAEAWYRGDRWLWLLRPLEMLFRIAAHLRRNAYGAGLLRAYRPVQPVVVVGNITVGGTGKTPVVIALVEALQARGLRPGVVSRGYGASAPDASYPHIVGPGSSAADCGDEPLLIQRRTGAPVVVAPKRAVAVRALVEHAAVDLVLSDDGLQHYPLARDLEVVIIDAERGLGNGFCLPAGPLREPPSRLASVDMVLYRNGSDEASAVRYQPRYWVNVSSGEERPLDSFAGARDVDAVAGIGQPGQFFASLRDIGISAYTQVYPDHHAFTAVDFEDREGRTILMTEKDAVKCATIAGPDAWYLRVDAQLPDSLVERVVDLAAGGRARP